MNYATCNVLGSMGRLGNQMFQMSATIGYAKDNNKYFVFPQWKYQDYIMVPVKNIKIDNEVAEDSTRYTELPNKEGNVNLHGHFMSIKYFNKHKLFIHEFLSLKPEWDSYILNKYGSLKNTCSIHVRRGDYLEPEQINNQGCITIDYYNKAIRTLNLDDVSFIVCSDDIDWCKENFKGEKFKFIEGENEIIDLFIMSKCSNNIISNSTFGWWSAYLNRNESKKVIAPIQWFVETKGWDDLYDDNWIKI